MGGRCNGNNDETLAKYCHIIRWHFDQCIVYERGRGGISVRGYKFPCSVSISRAIVPVVKFSFWLRFHNTWWRHQMETFSALLAICAGNSPVTGEFPSQRPVTRMFSLICAWINDWVNNHETGDLRHHGAHYDIIVMRISSTVNSPIPIKIRQTSSGVTCISSQNDWLCIT